jgi:hypothetical protein
MIHGDFCPDLFLVDDDDAIDMIGDRTQQLPSSRDHLLLAGLGSNCQGRKRNESQALENPIWLLLTEKNKNTTL